MQKISRAEQKIISCSARLPALLDIIKAQCVDSVPEINYSRNSDHMFKNDKIYSTIHYHTCAAVSIECKNRAEREDEE